MNMQIAICDDERNMAEEIARLVEKQAPGSGVSIFPDAETLLSHEGKFDILFLDIQMGGVDGMEAAARLRAGYPLDKDPPVIVFVTAHEGYMASAFDVGAFHYLLKPLDEAKFAEVFSRALGLVRYRRRPQKSILLKTPDRGTVRLELRDIRYFESNNKTVVAHTLNGPVVCAAKISELAEALGGGFFRCHRSYLVNLDMVSGFTRDTVTLADGGTVLMSRRNHDALSRAILRHEMEREGR